MATTTGSIGHAGDLTTLEMKNCAVSRNMLLSAFSENVSIALDVSAKAVLGSVLAVLGFWLLPVPGTMFFAALSASLSVIYLANLADVRNVRDAIVCVVPAFMVWGVLLFDVHSRGLLGLTLFIHVMVAFFAGFARVSGSLSDVRLWPVLFGVTCVTLMEFVALYLL